MICLDDDLCTVGEVYSQLSAQCSTNEGLSYRKVSEGDRRAQVGEASSKRVCDDLSELRVGQLGFLAQSSKACAAEGDDHRPFPVDACAAQL